MLAILDCFSKFCWCYMIKQKIPEQLINFYEQLFNYQDYGHKGLGHTSPASPVKPEYMWWDMEKAGDSKKFSDFLKNQGVKLYHTYSKTKVSIAERMIRTLKEKCEKVKTQYELEGKDYKLYEVLPQVLNTYNCITVHRTIEMTPADARISENNMKLQNRYTLYHKEYNPENNRTITSFTGPKVLSVGDNVRISAYKGIFDKGYKTNRTMEIFKIDKVQDTKPTTYVLKDKTKKKLKDVFIDKNFKR